MDCLCAMGYIAMVDYQTHNIRPDEFREWMKANTSLSIGSINLYTRTIRQFIREHEKINLSSLNEFISNSFRKSRSYYAKYAFKPFLEYLGYPKDAEGTPLLFKEIVRVKQKPRKKLGKYLPQDMIVKLIASIPDAKYRDMAALQFDTGARAREIITLREENIDIDFQPDAIRIKLEPKGSSMSGKETISFLRRDRESIIKKYMAGKPGFLFLPANLMYDEDEEIERVIQTERTYYYNNVRKGANAIGLDKFGTHDFRRNVAEILKRNKVHPRTIQKVLNHSSLNTTMKYWSESPEDVQDAITQHQDGGSHND